MNTPPQSRSGALEGERLAPIEEIKPGEALDLCDRLGAALRIARGHDFQDRDAWEKLARALAKRFDSFVPVAVPDAEKLLDNAATASQVRELLRDDDNEETVLREAVRMNVYAPLAKLITARSENRTQVEICHNPQGSHGRWSATERHCYSCGVTVKHGDKLECKYVQR